ncbi:MAG: glycosyltransferase family 39 protein [Acidimicrobiales bacterium]
MGQRRFAVGLGLIGLAAFVGRVVYVVTVTRHSTIMTDELWYTITADRLASGEGFTSPGFPWPAGTELAEHPPLPSVLLAPWVWLSDIHSDMPRFVVAAFGALVVVLVGLVANEVAGRRPGLVAAGLAAVYPNLWVNDGLLMSETFAALGAALTLYAAYRLRRRHTVVAAVMAGVAVGVAALARAELVLLLPLLVVPLALASPGAPLRRRALLASSAALACLLTVTPWVAYNLGRFDEPVLFTHDGGTLLGANCDDTYSGSRLGFWNGYCTLSHPTGDESVQSAEMRRAAFRYMADNVGKLPVVVAARIGRGWGVFRPFDAVEANRFDGRPRWISLTAIWSTWVVGGLAIVGAVALRRRGESLFVLAMPVVVVTLTMAAIYGRDRFRVPAEVALVVLAAVALDAVARRRAATEGPGQAEIGPDPPVDAAAVPAGSIG